MPNIPKQQADFERVATNRGCLLQLIYGGQWTVQSDKSVARAVVTPATLACKGFTSLKVAGSDYLKERLSKWGDTFMPDGCVTFPMRFPTQHLIGIRDMRVPNAATLDIIAIPPDTLSEAIFHMAYVRSGEVYNKPVTFVRPTVRAGGEQVVLTNVPARITFPATGGVVGGRTDTDGDSGVIGQSTTPTLEIPLIMTQDGSPVFFDPENLIVVDSATVPLDGNGLAIRDGLTSYNVDTPAADRGGSSHHNTFGISLKKD